jgi:translation initiation factor 2 subunit 2
MTSIESVYELEYLVGRLYNRLDDTNKGKKVSIPRPEIQCLNKKSYLKNFQDICKKLDRTEQEFMQFIIKESGSTCGAITGGGALVLTGIFRQNQMEAFVTNYIVRYVSCPSCKAYDTQITKEDRINYIRCNKCKSKTSIDIKY